MVSFLNLPSGFPFFEFEVFNQDLLTNLATLRLCHYFF